MYYGKLNQFSLSFSFPITFFDNTVKDIVIEEKYFIVVGIDRGYCLVVIEEEAQERLKLLIPDGKQ